MRRSYRYGRPAKRDVSTEVEMTREHSFPAESEEIATALVRARVSGKDVLNSALPVPANARCAMQIQALVQERSARPVGGWKVAIGPEKRAVAAPLLDVYFDSAEIGLFPNCTIEVELAVRLGRDLPKRETETYERSDIVDAIESLVLGIEVIGGRFDDAANVPFLSFLADNLGNRAYVIGDQLPLSIVDQIGGLACQVALDRVPLHHALASHPSGDPLLPLLVYANEQSDYLGGLKAGQVVTTGSLCGALPIRSAGIVKAELDKVGQVSVRFAYCTAGRRL
jgi:2-keto-4-pentenoate hydratase